MNYSISDEHSNTLAEGLESYSDAMSVARRYMSAHRDAPCVEIYKDGPDGESWILDREQVLEGK